jgi:uncharacterized cupredoxin-like copper-binding protein
MANVGFPDAVLEMREVQAMAKTLGLEVATLEIRRAEDIAPAFERSRAAGVRFVLENDDSESHDFVLATIVENQKHAELMKKLPNMEHDDPNAKRVATSGIGRPKHWMSVGVGAPLTVGQ